MNNRKTKSQELAAAKAGISERSARRIDGAAALPSQTPRRYWRSRVDPFAAVWDSEIVPLLKGAPKLMAITLLRKLQDEHPNDYPDGVLRTLQRHVRQWRALAGPSKEVFFPQDHAPGHRGLSDFTTMAELRITVAGEPFVHILYHFVLAFSRWEHVEVVEGGESFEALSKGLQNALWQAGGVPRLTDCGAAVDHKAADLWLFSACLGRGRMDITPWSVATIDLAAAFLLGLSEFGVNVTLDSRRRAALAAAPGSAIMAQSGAAAFSGGKTPSTVDTSVGEHVWVPAILAREVANHMTAAIQKGSHASAGAGEISEAPRRRMRGI